MTAVTYLTRHRRPGIVILCSIVAVLSMLFVLPPAIASAADSGAQAVDECNPTASNGCVNGILQDADKKPIADVTITLSGSTVPHETIGEAGAGRVLMKPAAPGTGVIAGGAVRAVVEAAGIKDIRTKCLRSNNPNNVVAAAFEGLKSMRGPEEVARIRGKSVEEIVG